MAPFLERKTCLAEGLRTGQYDFVKMLSDKSDLDQEGGPCRAQHWILGSRQSSEGARKGFLLQDRVSRSQCMGPSKAYLRTDYTT